MQLSRKHLTFGLLAMVAVAAVASHHLGLGLMDPALLAGLGALAMTGELEIKDISKLLTEQGKAFEEFKKANDERLQAKADGKAVGLSTIIGRLCSLYGPGAVETIDKPVPRRWLWRSAIRNYHHHNRVWIGWLRWVIEQALGDLGWHGKVSKEWWSEEVGVIKAALGQSEPTSP